MDPKLTNNPLEQAPIIPNRKSSLLRLVILFLLIVIPLIILFFSLHNKGKKTQTSTEPSVIHTQITQKPFEVVTTDPQNNATDIYPGEIPISFTTDTPIISSSEFTLEIDPPLPHYWKIANTYPTNKVVAEVYGGLQTGTTYTLTVKNKSGKAVYTWSFSTSQKQAESSSKLTVQSDEDYIKQYAPLTPYLPYTSSDFSIDGYQAELTINVDVKNPNIDQVKQEVITWIKSKGIDPSTHTINYINAF